MAFVITRRSVGLGAAGLLGGAALPRGRARAGALAPPAGPVLLSVCGRIGTGNDEDGAAHFDRPMLEALGTAEVLTSCPWYDGQVRFEGVRMDRLLDRVGARGDRVVAAGRGGAAAVLPREDLGRYGVILALRLNGAVVSTPHIGPLFVVYPYDSAPELRQARYYERSSWQVTELVVI